MRAVVCESGLKRCGVKDLCGGSKGQTRWVDVCVFLYVCVSECAVACGSGLKRCGVKDLCGGANGQARWVDVCVCAYLRVPLCAAAQRDRPDGVSCVCACVCVLKYLCV